MKIIFGLLIIICILNAQHVYGQEGENFQAKFSSEQLYNAPAMLIPFPQQIYWEGKFVRIEEIFVKNPETVPGSVIEELVEIVDFHNLSISEKTGFQISFMKINTIKQEAYKLDISNNGILIEAGSESGFFYALQTLRQLVQIQDYANTLPLCKITDWPSFSFRGYMLDVGRNFQSIESIKKQLDVMARYKMNVFHWHLTDRPAWRIESQMYPELTHPKNHRPTRDPGKFYSYEEIRDLIRYAKSRHITVIPEIDMPGHSDSFVKAMGVRMESGKGIEILTNILKEFFLEIPKSHCPYIHIGSDEVNIPNPDAFISTMVDLCEEFGREVIIWNPGLKANDRVIRQTWQSKHLEKGGFQEIDSWNNYVNNGEPITQVLRLFFKPIGNNSDNEVIGGTLCFWPDVNLQEEEDAFIQNPVYPSILTYAWATWTADITQAPTDYFNKLPAKGTEAFEYFRSFEKILLHHKQKYFHQGHFQYYGQCDKIWKIIGPFDGNDGDKLLTNLNNSYDYKKNKLRWKKAGGTTLVMKDRFKQGGYYPEAQPGQSVYALTYIQSDNNREIEALIGFETPLRANRTYNGIPDVGTWDTSGGNIWVNDIAVTPPEWENPSWKPSKSEGWGSPEDQEISWKNEELYWTRNPTNIKLKKGWNKIFVKIPYSTDYQNWMFTFVPLQMEGLSFKTESKNE